MHFICAHAAVAGALVLLMTISQVAATNQQLMDCQTKCSQRWSFPASASSIVSSTTTTKIKTSTHTPSPAATYSPPPAFTPKPTSTSAIAHNAQVKSSSASQVHVEAPTQSSKPSASTPAPAPTSAPAKPDPAPASTSPDINAYLDPHNTARTARGASPLAWSDELAAAAQKWADGCVFEHSGGKLGPYGENLAAGSGEYSAGSGVQAWVNEAPQYSSSSPVPSHFTQVVWKATTQVGCAVASCNLANFDKQFWPVKFHVCEYSSAGNVIGQFAENVQA